MDNELLFKNYRKSLEQKYNAICFDIDGTLTVKGSKLIDDRAIKMIADLLKRKIPVVFITGRGETGLDDLKENIYYPLKNLNDVEVSDLKKIYVLTNDGARLFYSTNDSENEFLNNDIYISTSAELEQLSEINDMLLKLSDKSKYSSYFNITYSKDLRENKIINVRMVFNTNSDEIINLIFDNIEKFIKDRKYKNIYLTRGIYKDKCVIQIGTATKDKAIERFEKIIGVPQNSMIRIGDCGDIRGNDYLMLNCSQGYSVDKTSGSNNSCFPIFDDNGNILKGIDATLHLVKRAKILPTVCLEKASKKDYIYNFAMVERNIALGRKN